MWTPALWFGLAAKQRGTVSLVAEDFVDDGDDVGDVDGAVVVDVALLVGEGDDHL